MAGKEAVTDESPDGQPTVGKADFLALFRRSRMVRDGDFLDSLSHTAKLGSHLGTEFKSAALQPQLRQQRASNDLVAGGFVVNAGTVKKISEMRQQPGSEKKSKTTFGAI